MTTNKGTVFIFTAIAAIGLMAGLAFADSLYVDSSGNVGIGTPSPDGEFHITSSHSTPTDIRLQNINSGDVRSLIRQRSGGNFAIDRSGDDDFVINSTGNVGIATTDPATELEVNGDVLLRGVWTYPDLYWETTSGYYNFRTSAQRATNAWTVSKGGVDDNAADDTYSDILTVSGYPLKVTVAPNYNVGIGATSPASALDVVGDIHLTGKLTSDGGNDPPYVLYNYETRQSVVKRVIKEVPPDKLDGAVLFFNGETSQMEIFIPQKGEFRSLTGELLQSIGPITKTFEVEDRYFFDSKTGEIDKYKVRKLPAQKFKIKENHILDPETGKFYKMTIDENGMERKDEVAKNLAVELKDIFK